MQCCYDTVSILQITLNRHTIAHIEGECGVSFVSSKSDLYSAFVTALLYSMLHYTLPGLIPGLCSANETALLCNDVSHWLGINLKLALYY